MAKRGRPPKYSNVKTLNSKINEYFAKGGRETKNGDFTLYTVSGLCVWLGITRETLRQYEKKPGFSDTVKKAKQRIENNIEEGILLGYLNPTAGIFNLKNNFGWSDKQEVEHSGDLSIKVRIPGVDE